MKRTLAAWAAFAFSIGASAAPQNGTSDEEEPQTPRYIIVPAKTTPALDGNWSGPAWADVPALSVSHFYETPESGHRPKTEAKAVYDAKGQGHAADLRLADAAAAQRAQFDTIRFFALDRPRAGAVAISAVGNALRAVPEAATTPAALFYALPADAAEPVITVPLYEYLGEGNAPPIYDVRGDLELKGYKRCPDPLCRVWPSPYRRLGN